MGSRHFSYDSAGAKRPSFTIYPRHSVNGLLSEDRMSNNKRVVGPTFRQKCAAQLKALHDTRLQAGRLTVLARRTPQ